MFYNQLCYKSFDKQNLKYNSNFFFKFKKILYFFASSLCLLDERLILAHGAWLSLAEAKFVHDGNQKWVFLLNRLFLFMWTQRNLTPLCQLFGCARRC